jgi:hypothetical protein
VYLDRWNLHRHLRLNVQRICMHPSYLVGINKIHNQILLKYLNSTTIYMSSPSHKKGRHTSPSHKKRHASPSHKKRHASPNTLKELYGLNNELGDIVIKYTKSYKKDYTGKNHIKRIVELLKDNMFIGHFTIEGMGENKEHFDTGNTCSMTISIEDDFQGISFQKKGLSRIMIHYMVTMIHEDYPKIRDKQKLFIDADASGGFWDIIGMKENPVYDYVGNNEPEGKGYEKVITFKELETFANKKKAINAAKAGGKRKSRKRKHF